MNYPATITETPHQGIKTVTTVESEKEFWAKFSRKAELFFGVHSREAETPPCRLAHFVGRARNFTAQISR